MADKQLSTLAPQDGDNKWDLDLRAKLALANLRGKWVAGAALLSGATGATASGLVLPANAARKKWGIQNTGTNVLRVQLGAGAIDLRGATAVDAGNGARLADEDWKGAVSVSGANPRYNWFEE